MPGSPIFVVANIATKRYARKPVPTRSTRMTRLPAVPPPASTNGRSSVRQPASTLVKKNAKTSTVSISLAPKEIALDPSAEAKRTQVNVSLLSRIPRLSKSVVETCTSKSDIGIISKTFSAAGSHSPRLSRGRLATIHDVNNDSGTTIRASAERPLINGKHDGNLCLPSAFPDVTHVTRPCYRRYPAPSQKPLFGCRTSIESRLIFSIHSILSQSLNFLIEERYSGVRCISCNDTADGM
ncbi:hypothetical protein BS17DRAFT_79390 [Gyrodon lividus]|nr:hypothetical protein BS17DRAFT_79390 [Gyrodon lividus]